MVTASFPFDRLPVALLRIMATCVNELKLGGPQCDAKPPLIPAEDISAAYSFKRATNAARVQVDPTSKST